MVSVCLVMGLILMLGRRVGGSPRPGCIRGLRRRRL